MPSGDSNRALILYVTKYSSKAMGDEKSVTQQPTCGAHMRDSPLFHNNDLHIIVCYQSELVILRNPLLGYEECSIRLTTEQVRCNECFIAKNWYRGVCWFVSMDSVGHVTLMNVEH